MFTRPGVHGFSHGIVSNDSRTGFSDAPVSNVSGMLGATLDNSLAIATWKLCGVCLDIGTSQKKTVFLFKHVFFHKKEIILPIDSFRGVRWNHQPETDRSFHHDLKVRICWVFVDLLGVAVAIYGHMNVRFYMDLSGFFDAKAQ